MTVKVTDEQIAEAKRKTAQNLGCTVEDLDRATQMVRNMETDQDKIRAHLFEEAKRCIDKLNEVHRGIVDTIIYMSDMIPGYDITNEELQRSIDVSNMLIAFYYDLPHVDGNKLKRILDAMSEDDKKQ